MELVESKLREICQQFQVPGHFAGYEHIKVGNVNQTYTVVFRREKGKRERYLLQRINSYAFRNPAQLMHNVELVTQCIHENLPEQKCIQFQHARDGRAFVQDREDIWRMYTFIPAVTYGSAESDEIVYETGKAFGMFQKALSHFDPDQLYETIPQFHNTPKRIENLMRDAERDLVGRVKEVQPELKAIAELAEQAGILYRMYEAGELPRRVTHNDTKMNNVLFDDKTGKAITVIDLDTVMPGLLANDFGDAIRFMANEEAEDSEHWEMARCNMKIFRVFTEGFLGQLKGQLTKNEVDTLCYSPFVLTLELASRFLDDYILGDPYFKTDYPEHNLVRTRCQLQMAKDCLAKKDEMDRIIHECMGM